MTGPVPLTAGRTRTRDVGWARPVPGWALVSATVAPVAMIGGWTVAAALQPPGFAPVRDTISALATSSAAQGWVMTLGLALTGLCHVVTAAGARPVAPLGRVLLALGGVGTAAVAALPVDVLGGAHGAAAAVGFVALALWPAAGWQPAGRGVLARRVGLTASAVLLGLLVWFAAELTGTLPGDGARTGLSERVVAGAQSLWPLVVVLGVRRTAARTAARTATDPARSAVAR